MSDTARPGVLTGAEWKDAMGRAWAALHPVMERMNRPVGEATAARAGVTAGDRVLDVGCGTGDTSLDLARRTAPGGRCLGVDISATLLDSARQAAAGSGLGNIEFLEADAQTHAFEPGSFDVIYSRFGVMFFEDFDAAFANLRTAATRNGRLAFTCWRKALDNPLSLVAVEAARPFLPPIPAPTPGAPGRFAFADPDRVRGILERSGWREIEIEPLDLPTPASFDELMALSLDLGMLGPILRDQAEAVRVQVREAVAAALSPHVIDGVVPMTAACWLVSAKA